MNDLLNNLIIKIQGKPLVFVIVLALLILWILIVVAMILASKHLPFMNKGDYRFYGRRARDPQLELHLLNEVELENEKRNVKKKGDIFAYIFIGLTVVFFILFILAMIIFA